MQYARPQRNRSDGEAEQYPEESLLHHHEWKMDGGRKEEGDVDRIVETLIVTSISLSIRIKRAAVVSGLDLPRKFGGVRISTVQEQFPGA